MKNLLRFLVVCFVACCWNETHALESAWSTSFAETGGSTYLGRIVVDSNTNTLTAGMLIGGGGNAKVFVVKYSNAGNAMWTNYYGATNRFGEIGGLAVDSDNNVIITTGGYGGPQDECVTIKYSGFGVPVWTNRLAAANAFAIGVDRQQNVFIAGFAGPDLRGFTMKLSSSGAPLWTNYFSQDYTLPRDLTVDGIDDVIVAAGANSLSSGQPLTVVKYANTGTPLWTNTFIDAVDGAAFSHRIVVDKNNDAIVAGFSEGNGNVSIVTLKYSKDGIPLWTNRVPALTNSNGQGYRTPSGLAVDADGDAIVSGKVGLSGTNSEMVTIKYSAAGIPLWTNYVKSEFGSDNYDVAVDKDGNVFSGGLLVQDPVSQTWNELLVAYSSDGQLLWTNNPAPGILVHNVVDESGNLYLGAWSFETGVIKLTKMWGIQSIPLAIDNTVMSWENPTFRLQSSPSMSATFTNVIGATSPYTNTMSDAASFFRLKLD